MNPPDVSDQIQVIATMLVALIFSERVGFSRKAGTVGRILTALQIAGGMVGTITIIVWGTGEVSGVVLDSAIYLTWWVLGLALLVSFSAWAALPAGRKLKGDPFGDPRRKAPKSPPAL